MALPSRPLITSLHAPSPAAAATNEELWRATVAGALQMDVSTLRRFTAKMEAQGHAIDASRLFLDSTYAYKRIALAHSSSDEALKAMALELFDGYQRLEQRRHAVSAFHRHH